MKGLVLAEGNYVSHHEGETIEKCKMICDTADKRCQSFSYCPWYKEGSCYLFDKRLTGEEVVSTRRDCYSNFKRC